MQSSFYRFNQVTKKSCKAIHILGSPFFLFLLRAFERGGASVRKTKLLDPEQAPSWHPSFSLFSLRLWSLRCANVSWSSKRDIICQSRMDTTHLLGFKSQLCWDPIIRFISEIYEKFKTWRLRNFWDYISERLRVSCLRWASPESQWYWF